MGSGDPNPCLHACMASSLQAEASPGPLDSFLALTLVSKKFSNPTGILFLRLFEIPVLCCLHPIWGTKMRMNINKISMYMSGINSPLCRGELENSS